MLDERDALAARVAELELALKLALRGRPGDCVSAVIEADRDRIRSLFAEFDNRNTAAWKEWLEAEETPTENTMTQGLALGDIVEARRQANMEKARQRSQGLLDRKADRDPGQ